MSAQETIESTEPKLFAKWREYPLEVKIMDLSTLAWLAIFIIEVILVAATVETNIRVFPIFMMPVFMFILTLGLRLRLVDKPTTIKNVFVLWVTLFILYTIFAVLILALYPKMVPGIV